MDRQAENVTNELQIIDQRKVLGKDFKVYGDMENPLFLAKDVADWIDYAYKDARQINRDVSKMLSTVDDAEKIKSLLNLGGEDYSHGGMRENVEMWFLTEDGLYEVLMQSRKPIAKQFKQHVKEILRSIRKHGAYMTPAKLEEMLMNPDAMITVLTALKDEQTKSRQLEARIKQDRPKVIFADAVDASDGTCLVGELAKMLKGNGVDMGQNRLFQVLRNKGYLIRRHGSDYNMPSQRSMDLGLFRIKETAITHSDGHVAVNRTPKVTGKGQQYFVNLFLGSQ